MLNSCLSNDLLEKRISVESYLGVKDYIWNYLDTLDVINYCKENNFFIYGGDVMRQEEGGKLDYTYDNWGLDEYPNGKNSLKSIEHSLQYINAYPNRENFFYSLTIEGM